MAAQSDGTTHHPSENLAAPTCPDTSINTDNRTEGDWKTRYNNREAKFQIMTESIFVATIIIISLIAIFLNWLGYFSTLIPAHHNNVTLAKYLYYSIAGLLGGTTYNAKYLYRAVGRGFWSQDRVVWRILSPPVSMVVAFIIGAMVECGFVDPKAASSGARCVVLGFLGGYFADNAVGFMCDIAELLFGKHK